MANNKVSQQKQLPVNLYRKTFVIAFLQVSFYSNPKKLFTFLNIDYSSGSVPPDKCCNLSQFGTNFCHENQVWYTATSTRKQWLVLHKKTTRQKFLSWKPSLTHRNIYSKAMTGFRQKDKISWKPTLTHRKFYSVTGFHHCANALYKWCKKWQIDYLLKE